MNSFLFAVHDIRESFSHTQLWLWTGLQDIKLRYRRSALGPWWLTISTGILVAAMGILYAGILNIRFLTIYQISLSAIFSGFFSQVKSMNLQRLLRSSKIFKSKRGFHYFPVYYGF